MSTALTPGASVYWIPSRSLTALSSFLENGFLFVELFHTERSHVRNLKVLERIFYRPLLDNGFSDLVNLLFPNLPEMLEIHGRFNALMKARKRDQPVVETVGDILVAMVSPLYPCFPFNSSFVPHYQDTKLSKFFCLPPKFDGPSGESFQQAAATFCKYQSVALENLRDRRKKESKLQVHQLPHLP